MNACFVAMLLLLVASSSFAQLPFAAEQAIEYAKSIDVNTLDPSLPSQRLEDWLRSGPPHTDTLRWESDETCDLKPFGNGDYPRCVRIAFGRGGQTGYFLVLIGTRKKGVIGPARLYEPIGVQQDAFVETGWAERLSGIPSLLDQPVVTKGVDDFYQRIVKEHPIGIPKGSDKISLWPFLSRRLTQQLETAQACQDDYFRQHKDPGTGPKPAWLDIGIFVGHGKRAWPLSAFAVHQESQKNDSFAVSVVLTYAKLPGFVPDEASWVVNALLAKEDNRFVIDDVQLFDGLNTDGPSHLLSETFAGCDGMHWIGGPVEDKSHAPLPSPHYTDWNAVNALRSAAYNEEVAFAKGLDVHQLDPSLPPQRFEDWLNSASLHVNHIEWESLNCNIKEGGYKNGSYVVVREPEGRLCANVRFQRGNASAYISVSTLDKGTPGPPKVTYVGVRDKDDGLLAPMRGTSEDIPASKQLADLPRLLKEESVIDVTRNLYDAIVAGHPVGIPSGQLRTKINPLLSKRLRLQLEAARACQMDYLRQNHLPTEATKPAWFKTGLFSGDGALALPDADLIDHKTRQEDGSFTVFVWLSREVPAVPAAASSELKWRSWHVSAIVKSEDDRYVVDDVQLSTDDSSDRSSRLLSDSFAGCDGARWVGINSTTR